MPDEWQQAAGESRRQAASQAKEIKTQAKVGALIEKPSQKRTSQRKLERQRSWQSQWMRQKARARKSAAGDPEVQWTADAGYSSTAQPAMQGPVEVESSPQACERDRTARAARSKPQAQRTSMRRDSGSHDSGARELGSGASRKTNQDSAEGLRERK